MRSGLSPDITRAPARSRKMGGRASRVWHMPLWGATLGRPRTVTLTRLPLARAPRDRWMGQGFESVEEPAEAGRFLPVRAGNIAVLTQGKIVFSGPACGIDVTRQVPLYAVQGQGYGLMKETAVSPGTFRGNQLKGRRSVGTVGNCGRTRLFTATFS
jgi:hypothetical protein